MYQRKTVAVQRNLRGKVIDLTPAQFLDVRGRVISRRDPEGKRGMEVQREGKTRYID